jgi:serine/threonine-protein kinase
MKPDPARVNEIFLVAIEQRPETAGAFVASACGDDAALRDEVLSLLAHHDDAELIATPAPEHEPRTEVARPAGRSHPTALDDRYREIAELGAGGCGRVARVYDRHLRRMVAQKRVGEDDETLRGMLIREARMLAYLDHPGAVQVFDCIVDGQRPSYTMPILEGETLHERLQRARESGGPISVGEALRIVGRVCETMANAHAKGLMHLDLKPSNIVLQPFGQVCVIDWGLARFHDRTAYETYLHAAGERDVPDGVDVIGGTPGYMPPESWTGTRPTPVADIYACGTILYELLAGKLPHVGLSQTAARALHEVRADVPARLSDLCMRLVRHDPAERPATFREVLDELHAMSEGGGSTDLIELATGDVVFTEGEPATVAYQILAGAVSVAVQSADGPRVLARRTVGDLVGELAIVSSAPRSATVTALEPTRLAVVSADVIERELATASPLLARMVRSLSDRLREETRRR